MGYIERAKKGDRLIYCSITQFDNEEIFNQRINELNKFLKDNQFKFKSTPALDTKSKQYFVRILGLKDVKLWDIAGVIK